MQTQQINTAGTTGTQVAGTNGILALAITGVGASAQGVAGTGPSAGTFAAGSLLAINISNASASDLKALQTGVDQLIGQVTTAGTQLGTASSVTSNQQTYVKSLSDPMTSGVGSLVDADMNVASTRLQALQTQQQLGIQVLYSRIPSFSGHPFCERVR